MIIQRFYCFKIKEIISFLYSTLHWGLVYQTVWYVAGKDFEQYLPLVMGPVMKTASMKPEVAVFDNEDMETIEGDVDWQFVSLGEQQNFGIRTAGEMVDWDSGGQARSSLGSSREASSCFTFLYYVKLCKIRLK